MGKNGSKPKKDTAVKIQQREAGVYVNRDQTAEPSRTALHNKPVSKKIENAKDEKVFQSCPTLLAGIKNQLQPNDHPSITQDLKPSKIDQSKEKKLMPQESENCASSQLKLDDSNYDSCTKATELSQELLTPIKNCEHFYNQPFKESLNSFDTDGDTPLGSSNSSKESMENGNKSKMEDNVELHQPKLQNFFSVLDTEEIFIFEDDDTTYVHNDTPQTSKSTSDSGSRIPLSCIKNKESRHVSKQSDNTPN